MERSLGVSIRGPGGRKRDSCKGLGIGLVNLMVRAPLCGPSLPL